MSEIPVHSRPRRLVDWINPTGTKKVHSLIDKVYKRKNLEMAWESVHANRGSGGVEGDTKRERVDRRRRPERLFRVCGPRETSNAGCPASSGQPSATPNSGNAQSGKLR